MGACRNNMTNVTRKEIESLTITLGTYIAEQIHAEKQERIAQIAELKNQIVKLQSFIDKQKLAQRKFKVVAISGKEECA